MLRDPRVSAALVPCPSPMILAGLTRAHPSALAPGAHLGSRGLGHGSLLGVPGGAWLSL